VLSHDSDDELDLISWLAFLGRLPPLYLRSVLDYAIGTVPEKAQTTYYYANTLLYM
jgi:hypothetical protein